MKKEVSRRDFMARTAGGAIVPVLAAPAIAIEARANEKIGLGFIGTGGRGGHHLQEYTARLSDEMRVAAVCDVDPKNLERAALIAGGGAAKESDFRKVLDRKDVDAVVIATPDHWHSLIAVRACEAGKDVYVEKPIGHNIREGRLVADAMKKHGRVVMIGTQQRSAPHFAEAVRRIRAGELGKVTFVHAWNAWNIGDMGGGPGPEGFGTPPDSDPPPGVDYDMWLGPAPKRPFNPRRWHFYFYFFWDFSGGMVSAWGVHLFDIVAWAMGTGINSVTTEGGKHYFRDMRDTPDTATTVFDCPGYTLTYTCRHANGLPLYGDMDHGIDFCGEKATLRVNRAGFTVLDEKDRGKPVFVKEGGHDFLHKKNFLACLRSRGKPNSDAEDGHLSCIFGHLANISHRVGRKVRWDAKAETIVGDPEAAKLLTREYRSPWTL
jgi:predicted dehydrogenase